MPFDPKLVSEADAPLTSNGDLSLPDDLAAIADQLRGDAARLSIRYPPQLSLVSRFPTANQHSPRLLFGVAYRSVAAASAFLATSLIGALLLWICSDSQIGPSNLATEPKTEFTSIFPQATAPISLTDLSSPELEALFDLVERQTDTITVSF
jgi:hypothetical protein